MLQSWFEIAGFIWDQKLIWDLTVITYDLQLFKKLIKLFSTIIITVIALLLDYHQIQVNYIKNKKIQTIISDIELVRIFWTSENFNTVMNLFAVDDWKLSKFWTKINPKIQTFDQQKYERPVWMFRNLFTLNHWKCISNEVLLH